MILCRSSMVKRGLLCALLFAYCAASAVGRIPSPHDGFRDVGGGNDGVLRRSLIEKNCIASLQKHLRSVALMFLVRGPIHHEEVWTRWLGTLSYRVPASLWCDEGARSCHEAMMETRVVRSVYDEQNFFTIVVHPRPDFAGYGNGSIFDGRIVKDRFTTEWGAPSLVSATRIMMKEALEDPFAQRFQLLCETTIPVRNAVFTWHQMLAHTASRVGPAHVQWGPEYGGVPERFPLAMHEEWPELHKHMRFHRQFITLTRQHAEWVAEDVDVIKLFEDHCFISTGLPPKRQMCVADESYFGVLLSSKLDGQLEGAFSDDMALAMLIPGEGVPAEDIDVDLLVQIRGRTMNTSRLPKYEDHTAECRARERPPMPLIHLEDHYTPRPCAGVNTNPYADLTHYPHCPYFARKFGKNTVKRVRDLLDKVWIIK